MCSFYASILSVITEKTASVAKKLPTSQFHYQKRLMVVMVLIQFLSNNKRVIINFDILVGKPNVAGRDETLIIDTAK